MQSTDWLLTDEFISFSAKIKEIHERKKEKKLRLKEIYEEFQQELKSLDAEALEAQRQFDVFMDKMKAEKKDE